MFSFCPIVLDQTSILFRKDLYLEGFSCRSEESFWQANVLVPIIHGSGLTREEGDHFLGDGHRRVEKKQCKFQFFI